MAPGCSWGDTYVQRGPVWERVVTQAQNVDQGVE